MSEIKRRKKYAKAEEELLHKTLAACEESLWSTTTIMWTNTATVFDAIAITFKNYGWDGD